MTSGQVPEREDGQFPSRPWRRTPRTGLVPSAAQLRRQASRATDRQARLREWHAMSEPERRDAWHELLIWVTWLHDRYELSLEERLPPCWPQHPGLIEELRALKAWRDEIYTARDPSGQAARYWHAELRQTINAATTFYAAGCRAGHRGATLLASATPELRRRWHLADPLAGIPASMLTPSARRLANGDFRGEARMRDEIAAGRAVPMSQTISEYLRSDGSWWQPAPGGWLRVDDPRLASALGRHAATMAQADAQVDKAADQRPGRQGS